MANLAFVQVPPLESYLQSPLGTHQREPQSGAQTGYPTPGDPTRQYWLTGRDPRTRIARGLRGAVRAGAGD
jgi:hypothetical protein